jgi:hypothetical protein
MKYVSWFIYNFCQEKFLILRRIEWDMIKTVHYIGLHAKYTLFLLDFSETLTHLTDFLNVFKYQISWESDE